jgi:hypothetical protein
VMPGDELGHLLETVERGPVEKVVFPGSGVSVVKTLFFLRQQRPNKLEYLSLGQPFQLEANVTKLFLSKIYEFSH